MQESSRTIKTPIGLLLVQEKAGAICRIDLVRRKQKGSDVGLGFGEAEKQLQDYFLGKQRAFSIPLKFTSGTELQQRVWKELLKIPYGERITYGELARRVKHPKAVRAVASAVGKNPIGIVVPCHRIVPASGKDRIGNYAWGTACKRQLLDLEKKFSVR